MRVFHCRDAAADDRRGVTLTEVLVAMMIMGIGVVLVLSLFPVSALRTLQASQLTSAAILSYNVRAVLEQDPELIFDPDLAGVPNDHFLRAEDRNYVVDPLGYHLFLADGLATQSTTFGNDGAGGVGAYSLPRFDGGVSIRAGSTDADALRLFAQHFASQPDGWTTVVDTVATGVESDGTGIVGVKLGELNTDAVAGVGSSKSLNDAVPFVGEVSDPEQYRVVVFDTDDRISQAFPLTYLDDEGTTPEIENNDADVEVSWSESGPGGALDFNKNGRVDARYLPSEFGGIVGRVLLQTRRTNDYTWMLTVRRRFDGDARNVDVVVRYRSGADVEDEVVFEANFGGDSNVVGVRNLGSRTPALRRGGWVCDMVNAAWYRINSVQEKPANSTSSFWSVYDYRLAVERVVRPIEGTGSDYADDGLLNGSDSTAFGGAVFPSDVIDVFPLGAKSFPDSLR